MENIDKVDPIVLITVAGEELSLKYTFRALKQFKKWTGKIISQVSTFDPEFLSPLIYCGLIGANPERFDGLINNGVPEKRIADFVEKMDEQYEFSDIPDLTEKITQALSKSQPSREVQADAKKE